MTNLYYTPSGTPGFQTRAQSAQQRNEDAAVAAGFDKLPGPDALAGGTSNYAVDSGVPSALVVPLNANIATAFDGMELVIKVQSAATGASTVTAGALAIAPVVRYDNSPIQPNDWLANQIITLRYNATNGAYQYTPPNNVTATASIPLIDSAPAVQNNPDASKKVRFDVSQVSPNTTRVATFPDRNIVLGKESLRQARTSNVPLAEADLGSFVDVTSGTFTQTFAAASALKNGWVAWYRNNGTSDVEVAAPALVTTTSATSNSIAAGTTWTVATGLSISPGDQVIVRRTSDAFNQRITGTAASYNSGTGALVVTVQGRIGSGTFTDWTITTGSASIDGLPSYVMYSGEARAFYCDGTNLTSVVISSFNKTFIAGGSFVKPPGYRTFSGLLWGGGGSGALSNSGAGSSGGGGGNCSPFDIPASALSAVTVVVIGAGAVASTVIPTFGSVGGTSSFGPISSYGGGGGTNNNGGGGGGALSAGSSPSGGQPWIYPTAQYSGQFGGAYGGSVTEPYPGSSSYYGGAGGAVANALAGNSVYGGAGGGGISTSNSVGATGGSSVFGGAGGNAGNPTGTNGLDGAAPGGGGGGSVSGTRSGAGARGELRIKGVA